MTYTFLCKQRARKMFPLCYTPLLLAYLILQLPQVCLSGAWRLWGLRLHIRGSEDNLPEWFNLIFIPWLQNLHFQPGVILLIPLSLILVVSLRIFVLNVFSVGIKRYILDCKEGAGTEVTNSLLWGFKTDYYGNIVMTLFLRDIRIFFGSLLFLFPGIIKSFEYLAVPWLVAEQPEKPSRMYFLHSRQIMDGIKMDAFNTLYFSSLLFWSFLNAYLCNLIFYQGAFGPYRIFSTIMNLLLSGLFVFPYRELTEAEFILNYRELKEVNDEVIPLTDNDEISVGQALQYMRQSRRKGR